MPRPGAHLPKDICGHELIQTDRSRYPLPVQVARENHLARIGAMSLDGTKLHSIASWHSALSYARAERIEAKRKAKVQELMALAEAAGMNAVADGVNLPNEIRSREDRLAAIEQASATIEARAQARTERERAEYPGQAGRQAARSDSLSIRPANVSDR